MRFRTGDRWIAAVSAALLVLGGVTKKKHTATAHPHANMTMDELRAFVQASSWKFAKSMPQTPHEYTLRREANDEDLFERVVLHIRQVGYHKKWGKTTYTYLDIDGWQYWTMGAPLEATILSSTAPSCAVTLLIRARPRLHQRPKS
jgi:hypothetical protein